MNCRTYIVIFSSTYSECNNTLERGQVSWRLNRLLVLDSIGDYNLFATVWKSAYGPEQGLGQYFLRQRRLPHYNRLHNEYQQVDRPLWKIERDEKDYFRKDFRNTIAKKLTLVSEWKTQYTHNDLLRLRKDMFIASPKMWKWIQQFIQDWEEMP
ncbi:unnamed protein product [Penicillium roqueforti FM164]|uniref:Genomic scaffold, ProqFM164S01 n=1 Tax=Penicillium roqueforti (strain FM164) TaxID=1365484 RepID=W6PY87_PENRF|nr:unnamed protein product [Penicillium roqueforti FM164]